MRFVGAQEPMLGVFTYSSAKTSRLALASKPRGIAHIFVMHVAEVLDRWPEADKRTRTWVRCLPSLITCSSLQLTAASTRCCLVAVHWSSAQHLHPPFTCQVGLV